MFNIYLAGAVSMCAAHYLAGGRPWIGLSYAIVAAANVAAGVMA